MVHIDSISYCLQDNYRQTNMAQKNKSPAQRARQAITEAVAKRGQSIYNIWLVRTPFANDELVINSDIKFDLFYFLEGDPNYVDITYPMLKHSEAYKCNLSDSKIFANVVTLSGQSKSIYFSESESENTSLDANLTLSIDQAINNVIVTKAELNSGFQRVDNWKRIIPCIRRIQMHSTATIEKLILLTFKDRKKISIRDIVTTFNSEPKGIVYGAIAALLRKRILCADLDIYPWCLNTMLWLNEL